MLNIVKISSGQKAPELAHMLKSSCKIEYIPIIWGSTTNIEKANGRRKTYFGIFLNTQKEVCIELYENRTTLSKRLKAYTRSRA